MSSFGLTTIILAYKDLEDEYLLQEDCYLFENLEA